jgi:hypothetical protein
MTVQVDLPEEVLELLGQHPERRLLEAVLLQLIRDHQITVGYAGQVLGLRRDDAIKWYTSHGYDYPDLSAEDLADDFAYARQEQ